VSTNLSFFCRLLAQTKLLVAIREWEHVLVRGREAASQSCLDRRDQRLDADDVHHAREVVGETCSAISVATFGRRFFSRELYEAVHAANLSPLEYLEAEKS